MRFHFGVSFRWKTIKKFLLPFLFGALAYFGFNGIFEHFQLGFLKVNAIYNANTSYNITLPNFNDFLYNSYCGNENAHDLVIDLINESSSLDSYITIIPNINNNSLTLYASKKSTTNVNRYYYYLNTGGGQFFGLMSNTNGYNNISSLTIDFNTCSSFTNSTAYNTWYNFAKNSVSYSNEIQETGFTLTYLTSNKLTASSSDLSSISNDNSYTINNAYYPYYSSRTMNFKANSDETKNYAYYFFKKICLTDNNTCYAYLDNLVSYYDIYGPGSPPVPPDPGLNFIGYSTSLNTSYTSINVNSISTYSYTLNFKVPTSLLGYSQDPQEYVDNTQFEYICSGRINNSNYYSYETFFCSLSSSYSITDNYITYTFDNVSYSQNLSNYDKLFITIKSSYIDNNINTIVYDYKSTFNGISSVITEYKGNIYDNFTSLPLNFKLYISSNNSSVDSYLYVRKYSFINYGIKYSGFSNNSQQQNLVVGNSILGSTITTSEESSDFIKFEISNNIDTGIMIYQKESGIPFPNLQLYFNSGMIISFNNSTDSFYYVDSSGTIQNNSFIPSSTSSTNKYDISYYINYINDFINDTASSSYQLSLYTQALFNGLPSFIQTFIFVLFIISNIFIIYLLIKR